MSAPPGDRQGIDTPLCKLTVSPSQPGHRRKKNTEKLTMFFTNEYGKGTKHEKEVGMP